MRFLHRNSEFSSAKQHTLLYRVQCFLLFLCIVSGKYEGTEELPGNSI